MRLLPSCELTDGYEPKMADWLTLVDYKVTESHESLWATEFGHKNTAFEYWNGKHHDDTISSTIVCEIDKKLRILEASVLDGERNVCYRWFHPEYEVNYLEKESKVEYSPEWELVDLITWEDFADKCFKIVNGEEYDSRITIPLHLTDEEEIQIYRAAHSLGLTIDEFVEMAVKEEIDRLKEAESFAKGLQDYDFKDDIYADEQLELTFDDDDECNLDDNAVEQFWQLLDGNERDLAILAVIKQLNEGKIDLDKEDCHRTLHTMVDMCYNMQSE